MPSSWATICAHVVSWPWPCDLGAGAQDRLAGHVHPQLGGVEHLDAEDVVLAAVAGAERLGHRRDADAEQPAAASSPPPSACRKSCVADRLQARRRGTCRTGPESVRKPNGVRCGKSSSRTKLIAPELGLVHAEVVGRGLHHALLEEHRLGDPERAPVGDAAGRLVRVHAPGGQVRGRDVVAGERRVHQPDLELARLGVGEERAVVGVGVHPDAEDLAVLAQRQLAVEVDVAGEAGRDQVAGPVLDPLHRALEQDRGQDRHRRSPGRPAPCCRSRRRGPGETIRIMCSGSSATSATAARMMCGACVVM